MMMMAMTRHVKDDDSLAEVWTRHYVLTVAVDCSLYILQTRSTYTHIRQT